MKIISQQRHGEIGRRVSRENWLLVNGSIAGNENIMAYQLMAKTSISHQLVAAAMNHVKWRNGAGINQYQLKAYENGGRGESVSAAKWLEDNGENNGVNGVMK